MQAPSAMPPADDTRVRDAAEPSGRGAGSPPLTTGRLATAMREDLRAFHLRFWLAAPLLGCLPRLTMSRLRTAIYRRLGVRIGPRALVLGTMELAGVGRPWERLRIGADCQITTPMYADLNAAITIGDGVAVGHHAVLVTTNHDLGPASHRCGAVRSAPIVIEDGCWLGARVTILPGVTVGRGSVVAAGAVVTRDVPPNTLVGGVPAARIRELPDEGA